MPSNAWSLVQFVTTDAPGTVTVGVLADDKVSRPSWLAGLTLMDVLLRWDEYAPLLRELDLASLDVVAAPDLVAPLTYPRKILCAGANYYGHAREMKTQPPDPASEPFFFLKPPTTAVAGPDAVIRLPDGASDVDWEAELAVVIGRTGRDVEESAALEYVAGYAVANDLSARGLFPRADAVFPAFGWDWFRHKCFDGSCPLGPGIVPSWQVEDPQELSITLSVNGQIKQHASTSDMVITVPKLIAAASRVLTLEPGDVILTGTPAGVGMPHRTFLHPGDVVVAEIEGVGRLENRMAAA
jgi:2-keto-4-pentenoate hydratase/2-oxohepta-3-ene-1,7-dioic acid hydratase in catechol pathway